MTKRVFSFPLLILATLACSDDGGTSTSTTSGGLNGTNGGTGNDATNTSGTTNGTTNGGTTNGGITNGGVTNGGSTSAGGETSTTGGDTSAAGESNNTGGSIPDNCSPDYSCEPEAPNTGDPYADCVARVNQFRACVCLPPLERNQGAEACMNQQAEYDSTREAHAAFGDDICEPNGSAQNECPGWRNGTGNVIDGCIQMMFNEGPPPTDPCEGQCYQDHGHYINMTGNYTSVACGFYETPGGEIWSVQNFFGRQRQ